MKIAGKKVHWTIVAVSAVVGVIILLQLVVFAFFQPLVGQAIRSSVSYFSDNLYRIDFEKINVQLFRKKISLEEVRLTYDTARVHQSLHLRQSKYYTGTAERIEVNLHEFDYFLSGRYLAVDAIDVNQPTVYVHRFPEVSLPDTTQNDTASLNFNTFRLIKPYFDSLNVASFTVDAASVGFVQHRPSLPSDTTVVSQVNILIEDAQVDSVAARRFHGWPAMKEFVLFLRDQTFTSADSLYDFHIDSVGVDPLQGHFLAEGLSVEPRWGKYEMGERLGKRVSWTQLSIARIEAKAINFPLLTDSFMLQADHVTIAQADFKLFRDLRLPSGEPKGRPLLQERLRSVTTPFHIDTLAITASTLQYEEHRDSANRAGRITFNDTYASLYRMTNHTYDSATVLKADVRTRLMGEGAAELHFTFPLTSTRGEHQINGKLDRMSLEVLNPTAEPLGFVSIKSGVVNRMEFDMRLNEEYATGNVRFMYENFKLSLLKKGSPNDKKGVKSWLANKLVIKDSNPVGTKPLRPGPIREERDSTRSMFTYWWAALRSGLEVSLGVKSPPEESVEKETTSTDQKKGLLRRIFSKRKNRR